MNVSEEAELGIETDFKSKNRKFDILGIKFVKISFIDQDNSFHLHNFDNLPVKQSEVVCRPFHKRRCKFEEPIHRL